MSFDLRSWSTAARAEVDATLAAAFPAVWPAAFLEPLRYPLSTGGKRFRPLQRALGVRVDKKKERD